MTTNVLTESGSENWATPAALFEKIARRFGPFDIDVAADSINHKADIWWDESSNALQQQWGITAADDGRQPHNARVWCNPPFNRKKKMYVGPWVEKAEEQRKYCELICMLVPARTSTKWWQEIVMKTAHRVLFVAGRVKFEQEGKTNSATFSSAIVIFVPDEKRYSAPAFDIFKQT